MIVKTSYIVPKNLLDTALSALPSDEFRYAINEPTGNFFYDHWRIKEEYRGTVWEQLLGYLPSNIGQARIILLEPGKCYQSHADIDDRYHLTLAGTNSFLINLETEIIEKLVCDGMWYYMSAGDLHSAANFGRTVRVQLVVRQLLYKNKLQSPKTVTIYSSGITLEYARFVFDQTISRWLNSANKMGTISNFSHTGAHATFQIEEHQIEDLSNILPDTFNIRIEDAS